MVIAAIVVTAGRANRDSRANRATPATRRRRAWWKAPSPDGSTRSATRASSAAPSNSYLPEPTDPFVPPHLVRQHALRRGDKIEATLGTRPSRPRRGHRDHRRSTTDRPIIEGKRPDFNTLTASYPERKLTLETGRPAKGGPELTRRAIDLIAPIGYGQRALIVAPARAGKTMLLQAIIEGIAINHPEAALLILLVDERPEEVSEMIDWGVRRSRGLQLRHAGQAPRGSGRHGARARAPPRGAWARTW